MKNMIKKTVRLALVALGITAFAPLAQAGKYTDDCITFSSAKSFSLKVASEKAAWDGTMFISTDKTEWSMWTGPSAFAAQAGGTGDYYLYVRGDNKNTTITAGNIDNKWVLDVADDGKVACSGNIETLRGATGGDPSSTQMADGCYSQMFQSCMALTAAPELPATTLAKNCYSDMFTSCISLTAAPELPATKLAEACYHFMFSSCRSLTAAPALNATTLATDCYAYMFKGCESLTDLPELPATTLAEGCYMNMFYDCSALEVNAEDPGKEWKLPSASAEEADDWNLNMFCNTKGTVEEPALDTTYYIASAVPAEAEPIAFSVTAPEHATVAVYTNEVDAANLVPEGGNVWSNRAAKAVYTVDSDKDWYFKGDKGWVKAITNTLDTTVNPAVDRTELPEIVEVTCTRKVVVTTTPEAGQVASPHVLTTGFTYTAAPAMVDGGAFYVNEGATLTGTNVTFAGNEAKFGGAIFNFKGPVALKDAVFTGNKAAIGGGAIHCRGPLSLDGVTFEGNTAAQGGAILNTYNFTVNFDGAVTLVTTNDTIISNGTLNWNLTDGKQGVLNGYDKLTTTFTPKLRLTVEDCAPTNIVIATGDFSDVTKKNTFTITNVTSGAVLEIKINSDVVVAADGKAAYQLATVEAGETTNLVFSVLPKVTVDLQQDHATAYTNGAPVTGSFSVFSNDFVEVSYKAEEGYYFADGTTEMEGIMFRAKTDPTTGPIGWDVNAYEPHVCDGVSFTKRITDTASLEALFKDGGNGYLATNVTLTANADTDYYFEGTIDLCLNGCVLDANGNFLDLYGGSLTIHDCGTTTNYFTIGEDGLWTLTDDIAKADTNLVGGVLTGGGRNSSYYWYPVLYVESNAESLTIKGGNFVGNQSTWYGGLIYNHGGKVNIAGGTFAGNKATGASGGVIYSEYYGQVLIDGGTFTGNTAKYGGVAYIDNSEITVNGGTFIGNAAQYGGVIYAYNDTVTTIDGGTFTGNSAQCGGVFDSYYDTCTLTVGGDATFVGNKGTGEYSCGGVFYNSGTMTLQDNVVISNNVADYGGVFYSVGTLTVTGDVQIVDNVATGNGGAIYNNSKYYDEGYPGESIIYGGLFKGNVADYCGGVYYGSESNATLTVCGDATFVGNKTTDEDGGGIFYNNGTMLLQGDAVISNNVTVWGTIYNYGTLTVTGDVQVVDNVATGNGGAIYSRYWSEYYPGECHVFGGTFKNNGNYAAFVNHSNCWFELGGSPVIEGNGNAYGQKDFRAVSYDEEYWYCAFSLSSEVPYDPPAGQKLKISAEAADDFGENFVTVLWNATEGDLDRFESGSEGYVLKYGWDEESKRGYLYLERPVLLDIYNTKYVDEDGTEIGTVMAKTNGVPVWAEGVKYPYGLIWSGTPVEITFTPTYTNEARYVFAGAWTNDEVWIEGPLSGKTTETFEMPAEDVYVEAEFAWQTNYAQKVGVKSGTTWEVFGDETYMDKVYIEGDGCVYGEGATFRDGPDGQMIQNNSNIGRVALTNAIFSSGKATTGGGGAFNSGTMLLVGCDFEGNSSSTIVEYGGAIYNSNNLLTLVDCCFTNNSAKLGGALYNNKPAEVVLRGMNTFETAKDTIYNGGTMTWDFTDYGTPYVYSAASITNEGTLKIAFDATLVDGCHLFLDFEDSSDSLQGPRDFVITDGTTEAVCTPDAADWTVVGAKRFKIEKCSTYYNLYVQGTDEVPLFFEQAEGGTFVVLTNMSVKVASGAKIHPGEEVRIEATPASEDWVLDGEHLQLVDVNGVTYGANHFGIWDNTACFSMVDASATLYAGFTASEKCRAVYTNMVSSIEMPTAMGISSAKRLSENEQKMFYEANHLVMTNGQASLYSADLRSPTAVSNQFVIVTNDMWQVVRDAKAYAEAKPYDVMIAADFSSFPDYDKETGTFTYGGVAYATNVNAFASFTAAYADKDIMPYATNVHVRGYQTIAQEPVAPKDGSKWNLDLIGGAFVTIGTTEPTEDPELVNITNKLGKITGMGVVILGKTEDKVAPSIYDDFIAPTAEIDVFNTHVEPWIEGGSAGVDVTAKVGEGRDDIELGGIESGSVMVNVRSSATNDVVVLGNLVAANAVTIRNWSETALTVAGDVFGKDVTIETRGEETSVFLQQVTASGDVMINNKGHLEANVTAAGKIDIVNGAPVTLVGTYEGAAISLNAGYGALSNVTFATTGTVTITGLNILTGPFAIEADEIKNDGTFIWDIRGGNHTAYLADYDATFNYNNRTVWIDEDQAVGTYVLADNASKASRMKLSNLGTEVGELFVGSGAIVYGDRAYSLTRGEDSALVLSVADAAGMGVSWTESKDGTFEVFTNGVKIVSGAKVEPGTTVTLKPTSVKDGYVFSRTEKFTVTDAFGTINVDVEVRDEEYYFTMPASAVTITPNFVKKTGCTVNGEDIALGYGDVWQLNYVTIGHPCIEIVQDRTQRVVLSGKVPGNRQVYVRSSSSTLADIILENVTIDVSAIDDCPAFVIECGKGEQRTLTLKGDNYLASGHGQSAIKVRCADRAFVIIAGEGSLTAIPGKAETILPAVGQYDYSWEEASGKCHIIGGTFNAAVDPNLVPNKVVTDDGTKYLAVWTWDDASWTAIEGGYAQFVSENEPYWWMPVAMGDCIPEPVPPAKAGNVFKGWVQQKGSELGEYWDFAKPLEPSDLEYAVNNRLQLIADFVAIEAGTTNSTAVMADGTWVVVDSFEKARSICPSGGTVIVSNEVVDAEIEINKPMVIVEAKDATVNVKAGEGYDKATSGDMSIIGQKVAGKVVVEKVTAPELIATNAVSMAVREAVQTVSSSDLTNLLTPAVLAKAAALAKDCDAAVAGVNLLVEPTEDVYDDDGNLLSFTVNIQPVLTICGITDGAVTTLAQETNSVVTATGEPITLTLYLNDFDKTPMLIKHTREDGSTEYFYNPLLAVKGEKTFTYDSYQYSKELSFETDSFSPFTISFVDEEQVEVTMDANGGYIGSSEFTTKTVWELSGVEGGVYRQLVTPTNGSKEFGGWYYGTERVRNGDAFATNGTHTLTAKWITPEPEPTTYTVTFDVQGHGKAPAAQTVEKGACVVEPKDPVAEGWTFGGWFKDKACTFAYDFATKVTSSFTLYAKWTAVGPEPVGTGYVTFVESDYETTEGDSVEVGVFGGSSERSTSVTLNFVKGTYTSTPTVYIDGEKAKFPLTLDWAKGEVCTQTVEIVTKKALKVEDRFFTLQLSGPAGIELGDKPVATVTVLDETQPASEANYVRALAWPANGGKVSGSGEIKRTSTYRTLKATAKSYATFAGWYLPMTNDVNQIDTNALITTSTSLKVGFGTEYGAGTYYAYFVDVLPVAAVIDPDVSSEASEGVVEEDGVYYLNVGVPVSLPIGLEDESGKGSLSVSSLPSGLRYSKKTGLVTGTPTKAGVKTVKVVAKNAAGKQTVYYTFDVEPLPAEAVGTWNGVVRSLDDDATHAGMGTVQFSATSAGKLSAKVTTRLTGTKSFSAKNYEFIDENTFGVTMATRYGETFVATLSLTNDWTEAQLFGTVTGGAFEKNGEECRFAAIKNAFDKKTGESEAIELLKLFKGTYEDTLYLRDGGDEIGSVTFKVQDGGKVQVKAKSQNGTYSATCAGAFRILSDGEKDLAAVQAAIRSGKKLWACDATVKADSDDIEGFACDYDSDGDDTHETIGVPVNRE